MNQQRQSTQLARPAGPTVPAAPSQGQVQTVKDVRQQTRDLVQQKMAPALKSLLPSGIQAEQFQASLINTIDATPELMANPVSLALAVYNLARLGLDTNPVLQLAYLIPREVSQAKKDPATGKDVLDDRGKRIYLKKPVVTMQIGYKGFIFLGRRARLTSMCEARVVRDGDEFDYTEGLVPNLVHRPKLNGDGEVIAAYARAIVDGRPVFRLVDQSDIRRAMMASSSAFPLVWDNQLKRKVRDTTKLNPDSPWSTDYEAMAMKTAIRRFYKSFDLVEFAQVAEALAVDASYDKGKAPVPLDASGSPMQAPAQLGAAADWRDEIDVGGGDDIWPEDDRAGDIDGDGAAS